MKDFREDLMKARQQMIDAIAAPFEICCPQEAKVLAKKLAGNHADTIVRRFEPVVIGNAYNDGKHQTAIEDVQNWQPYWVTFVSVALRAIELREAATRTMAAIEEDDHGQDA